LIGRCYKAILGFLLLFFFAARLYFDFPTELPPMRPLDRELVLEWVAKCFLFVIDVAIFVATVRLFARFVNPVASGEAETGGRVATQTSGA
jgi:hypothetical protein